MRRGPLFSGHTYSRVSKNCTSMTVSALKQSACGRSTRTDLHCFYWNTIGLFWSTFIYTTNLQFPSSPVVLINSVGQKVWLGLFKGQASIPRWVSIFLKVLRKNNQNTKDSLRSWRDLWRASASFHGCFRCFCLGCKAARRIARLKWRFLARQEAIANSGPATYEGYPGDYRRRMERH